MGKIRMGRDHHLTDCEIFTTSTNYIVELEVAVRQRTKREFCEKKICSDSYFTVLTGNVRFLPQKF